MSLCILGLGQVAMISAAVFTLSWTHSVEGTRWEERWQVGEAGFQLVEARIKGSGAGMEPPQDAVWRDGWWVFRPKRPAQKSLVLSASGATQSGWTLCTGEECRTLGETASRPITLMPCPR
jgi:hypothetical protein